MYTNNDKQTKTENASKPKTHPGCTQKPFYIKVLTAN